MSRLTSQHKPSGLRIEISEGEKIKCDVLGNGAVLLGDHVCSDGFDSQAEVRVQSHIHDDHMGDFDRSKGRQNIVCSVPTHELLTAELDADLPYRSNFIGLEPGVAVAAGEDAVRLYPSDHMLGAVQVEVRTSRGVTVGYSGDFQWPMSRPISADVLVLDATAGAPTKVREYSQGDAEEALVALATRLIREGPVCVYSHRGTLHRGIQVLGHELDVPLFATQRIRAEAEVYRRFGYPIPDLLEEPTEGFPDHYLAFYGKGDSYLVEPPGSAVKLSTFQTDGVSPVVEYSNRAYGVALCGHADHLGTLEYVEATGARWVVTDNVRGPYGVELALEIERQLGVSAVPSSGERSLRWG